MDKSEILYMQHVAAGSGKDQLTDFCFHICQGEMVELFGISGAGKTAIYNYFMGYEPLKAGRITFHGRVYDPPEKFQDTKDVVCVSRKSSLISALTIAENLCIITGRRKTRGFIRRRPLNYRVNLLLQQFLPQLRAEMRADSLTLAQKHMVELLRAMENEAKLVYMDDIMSGYSQWEVGQMRLLLAELIRRGMAIICARHGWKTFSGLTSRVLVLSRGVNVKTFYEPDFDQQEFNKWLLGSAMALQPRRASYRTAEVVFRADGLTGKNYVTDFSMDICRGEVVGFYDMNNNANVEAARLLAGREIGESGRMEFMGRAYGPRRVSEAIDAGVGYIPWYHESSGVVETMGFSENILLPVMKRMSYFGIFRNRKAEAFLKKEYMAQMDIPEDGEDVRAGMLGIYARQQIVLKKWLLRHPDLLVCEELAEDNDMKMRGIIAQGIDELASAGIAVVITAHDMTDLMNLCDTIYIMDSFGNYRRVERIQVMRNVI